MKQQIKIVVISDTHIPTATNHLPHLLLKEIENATLCIHAGDFITKQAIDEISKRTRLYAVSGNMDSSVVQGMLPKKKVINIKGIKIGIIHKINPADNIPKELKKELGNDLDIYIFGHTHAAFNTTEEGKLFFNPGSPTDKFFAEDNSFGIIEIADGQIKSRIVSIPKDN